MTKLPLHPIDLIQYRPGDGALPHEQYLLAHAALLRRDEWIIDGFGCVASAREWFTNADTLVYVDLPLATHHWWVTKRLLRGLFVNPEGWPANSRSGPARSTAIRCFGPLGEIDPDEGSSGHRRHVALAL